MVFKVGHLTVFDWFLPLGQTTTGRTGITMIDQEYTDVPGNMIDQEYMDVPGNND